MDDLKRTRARLRELLDAELERDALTGLRASAEIQRELSDLQRDAVRAATAGHTWAEIGEALGVSRQGAHQKFAKEWAPTLKAQVKAEALAEKAAHLRGDHAAAAEAKRSREALIADYKTAVRGQRGRGRRSR